MKQRWSGFKILWVFLLSTMLIFLLLIYGLPNLWCSLNRQDICTESLAAIEALSTALAAAAVIGASVIAYREISEFEHMDVADRLFIELNSSENIEARKRIFQSIYADPKVGLMKMTEKDRDAMKKALNSLDRVAFLTQSGGISDDLVMPWLHPMISKTWEKLEPYVLYERKRRNEPYYYQYAERLAERCNKWREKNQLRTTTKWVDSAL
jgi:hypothetical protein